MSRRVAGLAAGAMALVAALVPLRGWLAIRGAAASARRELAARRFAEAEGPLRRWLDARPRESEPHYLVAVVAVGLGRPQEAINELARARALGHPPGPIDRLDAILRARAGRGSEAEPVLRRLLDRSDAHDPEAAEALARIYLEDYNFPAAARALDRWVRDAPDDPRPHLGRVEVDTRLGHDASAPLRDYRAALARDPGLAPARLGLAEALRRAGRPDEAAAEYAAYLALRPDDGAGHLGAGLIALDRGDPGAAAVHLDRAIALTPESAPALSARAGIALLEGEDAAALAMLDRAVRADPFDVEARHRRGLALARLGRPAEARDEGERVARLRDDARRLGEIQQALVRDPKSPDLQAEVARWMIDHGHDEEGLRWARKALRDRPDHPASNRLMVEHHDRRGEPGLANYYRTRSAVPDPAR
jgi:tetratricopeptide (TPR) repeat protein